MSQVFCSSEPLSRLFIHDQRDVALNQGEGEEPNVARILTGCSRLFRSVEENTTHSVVGLVMQKLHFSHLVFDPTYSHVQLNSHFFIFILGATKSWVPNHLRVFVCYGNESCSNSVKGHFVNLQPYRFEFVMTCIVLYFTAEDKRM